MVAVIEDGAAYRRGVHALQLRQGLDDEAYINIPGPYNGDDFVEVGNDRAGREIVHDEPYRDREPSVLLRIGLRTQDLEGLGVKAIDQRIIGPIGIADIEKQDGF